MKIKKSIGETFRKITKARGNELMIKKGVSSTILYLIQLLRTILSYIYKRWFQKCYFIQSYNPSCRKLSNRAQLTRRSYNYLRYVICNIRDFIAKNNMSQANSHCSNLKLFINTAGGNYLFIHSKFLSTILNDMRHHKPCTSPNLYAPYLIFSRDVTIQ